MSTLFRRTNHRAGRLTYFVFASLLLGIPATFWATGRLAQDQTGARATLESLAGKRSGPQKSHATLPLSFELNQGQTNDQVKFLARAGGYLLFLTPTEAVMALDNPDAHRRGKE